METLHPDTLRSENKISRALVSLVIFVLVLGTSGPLYMFYRSHKLNGELTQALAARDETTARSLIRRGAYVNTPGPDGNTILAIAAAGDRPEAVTELLEIGADPKTLSAEGQAPLHAAAANPHTSEILRLFLYWRTPVDTLSGDAETPLMIAAKHGLVENVKIVLRYSPNLSLRNREGKTALELAREKRSTEIVTLLEEAQSRRPGAGESGAGGTLRRE